MPERQTIEQIVEKEYAADIKGNVIYIAWHIIKKIPRLNGEKE